MVTLGASHLRGQGLDFSKPPGGNFNLTNFYLGLPVDNSGGTNGDSASIPAAQLVGGYSNALYFYTGPDGAMIFWAPVTGATTSGSSYPRSELREQIIPPLNSSNWVPFGVHLLSAQCRVTQVPTTGKVIIGQIHCYTGNARPLLKLQDNNGVIEALVKTNSNFDPDYKFFFQNVGLSNLVNYQIRMENGLLTTTVNGSNRAINVFLTDPDWATNGLYFKAGSYCQDNAGTTNEGGRIAFYALARSHGPSITDPPANLSGNAGSNGTFTVNAVGNGRLRYQWFFNQTNTLANATNGSLTLTNIQFAHAGDYSVRVTDNLGVVTSSVATLTVNRSPVPGVYAIVTGEGILLAIPTTNLLALASDPEGDGLSVASVEPVSGNGGGVTLSNSVVWYRPPAAFVGVDQWNYALIDARGASANASVTVTVVSSNAITLNPVGQRLLADGSFSAWFQAVPGLRYVVDRATNLAGPWELGFTNLSASTNGLLEIIDPTTPAQPLRFYRTRYP